MRRKRSTTVAAATVAVVALLLAACGGGEQPQGEDAAAPAEEGREPAEGSGDEEASGEEDDGAPGDRIAGGQIVVAAEQEPAGLNYNTAKDRMAASRDVITSIHFFAAKAQPDGSLVYVGLEHEPEVVAEDPQVVEWTIREDANWSDGTAVTTGDIEFYFDNIVDPDNDVASREGYEQITELELVDDKTFRATFEPLYVDFRGLWQAVPQAEFLRNAPGGWEDGLNNDPGPSAGPYVMESWNRGVDLTLVPNPEWAGDVLPTLDRIILRFLPDSATLPDALRNNEVDVIQAAPQVDLLQQIESLPDMTTQVLHRPAFEHLVLNTQHPVVGDVAVRQAIAHGVDRNQIVEAMVHPIAPDGERLDNLMFTDVSSPYYEPHGQQYAERNAEAGIAVLEDAGWTEGEGGIRERDGEPLTFVLSTTAGDERREQTAQLIQSHLRPLGFDVRIETLPSAELFGERLPAGQFEVTLKAFSASPFPVVDARARFSTGGGDNYGDWSSEEFDALIEQASQTLDVDEQAAVANQAGELLWEGLTMIPIHQLQRLIAHDDDIVGVVPNGTREGLLWNSEAWGRSN